jgi:hypothetical protein
MCVPFDTKSWLFLAREQSGTSALVVLMPEGWRFGSCHGDLYFDPVDAVCGVVAGWSRATARFLHLGGDFACTLAGAILGHKNSADFAID